MVSNRSVFGGEDQLCSSCSVEARAEAACMHETSKCLRSSVSIHIVDHLLGKSIIGSIRGRSFPYMVSLCCL